MRQPGREQADEDRQGKQRPTDDETGSKLHRHRPAATGGTISRVPA
jgi:hypothetical protein